VTAPKTETTEEIARQLALAKRLHAIEGARTHLMRFIKFMRPDPDFPDDIEKSSFEETPVAKLLCDLVEKMERGHLLRALVSIPPQHGKSDVISRYGLAWKIGKNPHKHRMLGTYSQDFADDFGSDVREIMLSPLYRQVFPYVELRKGSKAKDAMVTTKGGKINFLGRGGAATGKPADDLVVDDPIKDDAEAQSGTIRKSAWSWFNKSLLTRTHRFSPVMVVHTRWNEDDIIGRLADPSHPDYNPDIAKRWTYINVPALVTDPKLADALGLALERPTDPEVIQQFGDRPMSALWEKKDLKFLAEACLYDKRGFYALYMGQPAPDDGDYFKKDWIVPYRTLQELPRNLRKYGASDHALTEDEENDATCLGCFGIDENDEIWILPDLFWERVQTDEIVEAMLARMQLHKPLVWWAEDEHISKGMGPFLRKRMMEEKTYITMDPIKPGRRDLRLRARSIQGRMQNNMVHFPTFASWWPEAQNELLKFPNGAHDDFVSFMALIGLGLMKEVGANKPRKEAPKIKTGTLAWVKSSSNALQAQERLRKAAGGM
jgi:predicted phage terminase large subunit-like protein